MGASNPLDMSPYNASLLKEVESAGVLVHGGFLEAWAPNELRGDLQASRNGIMSPNLLYQMSKMNYFHSLGGSTPHDYSLMFSYSGFSVQADSELRESSMFFIILTVQFVCSRTVSQKKSFSLRSSSKRFIWSYR